MSEFDWSADDSVVCHEQPAFAIYENGQGQVVIRAERRWDEEQDPFITINKEYIVAAAYALLEAADLPMEITERCERGWRDVERPARPSPSPEPDKAKRNGEDLQLALPAPELANGGAGP